MGSTNSHKKLNFIWILLLFISAIGITVNIVGTYIAITPPVFVASGEIVYYSIPLGQVIYFAFAILVILVGLIIIAIIRGIISNKVESENEFKSKKINIIFSYYSIFLGIFLFSFLIWFVAVVDWNLLKGMIENFRDEAQEYIIIAVSIILLVFFFGLVSIIVGIKSKKRIRFYGYNNPNILAKIGIVLIALVGIAGMVITPSLFADPNIPKEATIPITYEYNIGPFIQFGPADKEHVIASPQNNMQIWWFTANATSELQTLKYGKSPDILTMNTVKEIEGGDNKYHLVQLGGLESNTRYYYTIPGFTNKIYNFTTAPDENTSFRFACVGDTRNSGGNSTSYYGYINRAITNFYNSINEDFAFKINVGDIPSSGTDLESWKVYFDDVAVDDHAATHPHMIAMGNHELGGDNGANYDYVYAHPRYYSFDYGPAHFIQIHTFDSIFGVLSSTQLRWLENELKEYYEKKFIIVSFHVPPLSTGDFNMNPMLQAQLVGLFREYKVDLVLTGHDHHYDSFWVDKDTNWNGTLYYLNGGGGSPLDHYIMTRTDKQWKTWYHNRSSSYGLYQDDYYTVSSHVYGELSHGFMDIKVTKNQLIISYYRWLSLEKYFNITGQTHDNYSIRYFTQEEYNTYNLGSVELVHTLVKERTFT